MDDRVDAVDEADGRVDGRRPDPVARLLVVLLHGYRRFVSPLLPPSCRFHPTCSSYAITALRTRGVLTGTLLTLVRLAKCGPWHPGGVDYVPPPPPSTRAVPTDPAAPTTEEQAPC